MATATATQLGQAAIGTSVTTLYTAPGSTTAILKSFDICNTTPSPIGVNVFLVPSGGSAATGNALLYGYPVPANGDFGWEGEQVLPTGATIQVQAALAGLTITASGVQLA